MINRWDSEFNYRKFALMRNLSFFVLLFFLGINSYGQIFDWVRTAGLHPGGNDHALDIEMDMDQNVVVCGRLKNDTNFDTIVTTPYGHKDIFVVKYDRQGNLLWLNRSGGIGDDYATNVYIDSSNHVFVSGVMKDSCYFSSSDGNGLYRYSNFRTAFFLEYNENGVLLWVEIIPNGYGESIYSDEQGNLYVSGMFVNYIAVQGDTLFSQDENDGFLVKYDSLHQKQWMKSVNGGLTQTITEIEADEYGNIYILGMTRGDAVTDSIVIDAPNNNYDCFVGKINENGNYVWIVPYGGNNMDTPSDLEYDELKQNIVFSAHKSTNGVVVRMDTASNVLQTYTLDGVTGTVTTGGVHVGINGDVFVSGRYTNDLKFMGDTIYTVKDYECYVIQLSDSLTEKRYKSFASNQLNNKFPVIRDVVQDSLGDLFLAGEFLQTVSFDSLTATSSGISSDLLIAKIEMPIEGNFHLDYPVYCDVQEVCFDIEKEEGNIHFYELLINGQAYQITGDTCISGLGFGSYDVSLISHNYHHTDTLEVLNAFSISNQNQPIFDTIIYTYPFVVFEGVYDSIQVFWEDSLIGTANAMDTSFYSPYYGNYYAIAYNSSGCYTYSDTVFSIDGINENELIDFHVFPNPSKGLFYYASEKNHKIYEINVYAIDGRFILNTAYTGVLDLRGEPNGFYLIEAIYNGESIIKRVVKAE